MKNKKIATLIVFIILLIPIISFAHPGRLDSNGGHWDRKAGTYHFHEGKNTSGTSGSSSYREYEPFVSPYTPPTDNPYKKNSNNKSNSDKSNDVISYVILTILAVPFVISPLCFIGEILWETAIEPVVHFRKNKINKLIYTTYEIIRKEVKRASDIDKAVKYILASPTMTSIPFFIEITDGGLSARNKSNGVNTIVDGKKTYTPFIYYISSRDRCFHTKKACSNSKIKLNAFEDIVKIHKMLPCRKCASKLDMAVLDSILECYTSFMDCKKYEQNKNRYLAEIKSYRCELVALSQTKTDLLKKLKTKEKYIKKHNELSKKYGDFLNYIDEREIIVCDESGQYSLPCFIESEE